MSTSNKNQEVSVSKSKNPLVRAIKAFLNLGDEGKLESFFQRVNKTLKKENTVNTKNLENLKFNHEQNLETLKDRLEDANEALDRAYMNINVDRIQTNEQQEAHVDVYLAQIDDQLRVVSGIEKDIERAKERYTEDAKQIQDQIDSNTKRLARVGEEA